MRTVLSRVVANQALHLTALALRFSETSRSLQPTRQLVLIVSLPMTLIQLDIVPHIGIGPVRFGMAREEVEAALASVPNALPRRAKGRSSTIDCYIEGSLQIEFGEDGTASFVEVWCHPATLCTYKGQDVFDLPAPDLFALLAADDGSGHHRYDPSEYLFPELIVSLWDADEQYDRKGNEGRAMYATVGVGDDRYLAAVRKIRGDSAGS